MYNVKIFIQDECIDERDFAFGTWNEIGLWLDHYSYNDPRYRAEIHFSA